MGSRIRTVELKQWTMACWWPSRITRRTASDWDGIIGELTAQAEGALVCRDDPSEAAMLLRLADNARYERDCAGKTGKWTSQVPA